MLKPQDIVLLLKLLVLKKSNWTQPQLANWLQISASEINAGIKRLSKAGLLVPSFITLGKVTSLDSPKFQPSIQACKEFLIHGLKYVYPAELGEFTRGFPTSHGTSIFEGHIQAGEEPLPVWPHPLGNTKGFALKPLYPSVPEAIRLHPDPDFQELLYLIDAIRQGKARERKLAAKLLSQKIDPGNYSCLKGADNE